MVQPLQHQWQKRWLLQDDGSQVTLVLRIRGVPRQEIRDWFTYPLTPHGLPDPTRAIRFRQIDNGPIIQTTKVPLPGQTDRRSIQHQEVSPATVEALGEPSITKLRFTLENGRFVLDVYRNKSLNGIAVLEQHIKDDETPLPPPEWTKVFRPLDVTDSLTSSHLALIQAPDDPLASQARLTGQLGIGVPTIVLTGAPCCGKTTIIEHVARQMPSIRIVPEAATIAIVNLRCPPPTNVQDSTDVFRFQRFVRDIQLLFEGIARQTSYSEKQKAVLVDRGIVDSHAYLARDPDALYERIFDTTPAADYRRYNAVLHLAPIPRAYYEEKRKNNSARQETYDQVVELDRRMAQAWGKHRRYMRIGEGQTWEEKLRTALEAIERYSR